METFKQAKDVITPETKNLEVKFYLKARKCYKISKKNYFADQDQEQHQRQDIQSAHNKSGRSTFGRSGR